MGHRGAEGNKFPHLPFTLLRFSTTPLRFSSRGAAILLLRRRFSSRTGPPSPPSLSPYLAAAEADLGTPAAGGGGRIRLSRWWKVEAAGMGPAGVVLARSV